MITRQGMRVFLLTSAAVAVIGVVGPVFAGTTVNQIMPERFGLTYAGPQHATSAPAKKADEKKSDHEKKPSDEKKSTDEKSPDKSSCTCEHVTTTESAHDYRGVSSFFNIREANPDVAKGEWEFEATFSWQTNSDGSDDDVGPSVSLYYGIDDDAFVELEVMQMNLGDGGDQGIGDLELTYFRRHIREGDVMPAFATRWSIRVPSGDGSSGVDGEAHFILTKTLAPNFRTHVDGFIETANGGRGDEDIDRRYFQWGVGPGFDYSLSDQTTLLMNYLHRCSEFEGHHNQNILEFGLVQALTEKMCVKAAFDVGLDGAEETPNFAAKVLWSIEF